MSKINLLRALEAEAKTPERRAFIREVDSVIERSRRMLTGQPDQLGRLTVDVAMIGRRGK